MASLTAGDKPNHDGAAEQRERWIKSSTIGALRSKERTEDRGSC
jgi:hypothetical protein